MKLFRREQAHKDRGHWHFDWSKQTMDVDWIDNTIRLDICEQICNIAKTIIEENYYWYQHPKLLAQNPMWARRCNLDYASGFEHPEFIASQEDNIEPFLGKPIDLHREFLISINPKDFPELLQVVEKIPETSDFIDLGDSLDTRVLVQMPGQMTLNHIDPAHIDYDKRQDRFEEPKIGDKYWCALSPRVRGQYIQWGNTLITDWSPGRTFKWDWGIPHWTANYSTEPRISMTVRLRNKQ